MVNEENVLYGGPAAPPIIAGIENLGETILKKLEEHGDNVLIISADTDAKLTANVLRAKAIRLVECLRHLGVRKGDTVSICSENQLEFQVAQYAILFMGGVISPWNPTYSEFEVNHVATLTKPKVVFSSNMNIKNVMQIAKKHSFIKHVIAFEKQNLVKGAIDYNQLLNDKKIVSNKTGFKCTEVGDDDTVLILVSSGTTGLPKGVEISRHNLKTTMEYLIEYGSKIRGLIGELTVLNIMPWFHAYGLLSTMGAILGGGPLITMAKFKEKLFLSTIEKYQVQGVLAVPPIIVFLAKSPLVKSYDLSSLLIIGSGAAPLRKETIDALNDRLGTIMISQAYGLSETTLGVLGQKDEFRTPGSVGSLNPGTWGKIVDPKTGKNLGPNEEGEMCFKGSFVMKGYLGNAQETSQTIDTNGWLHTGDIGYYNEEGEWFIVDRLKELIKFKGFQVPPAELESILMTHPKIVDAGVIGLPDEKAGELPLAFIVKRSGEQLTEKDVIQFIEEKMSYAKRLHGGVRFINEIPRNPSGKILRRVLKERAINSKSKL